MSKSLLVLLGCMIYILGVTTGVWVVERQATSLLNAESAGINIRMIEQVPRVTF